jgi:hypothetical protein
LSYLILFNYFLETIFLYRQILFTDDHNFKMKLYHLRNKT